MDEDLERLRAAAQRGKSRSQYRVSVSPGSILRLFNQRDSYEKELLRIRPYVHPSILDAPRPKPRIEL